MKFKKKRKEKKHKPECKNLDLLEHRLDKIPKTKIKGKMDQKT
jgi:hypothetical protein